MASADDLHDERFACIVQSAAIGLVLGLVLGLNLGLGRLCRKVGSIAALYAMHAGSFIPLTWGKISLSWGTTSHLILKRVWVGAEVMVRVRVRLVYLG